MNKNEISPVGRNDDEILSFSQKKRHLAALNLRFE